MTCESRSNSGLLSTQLGERDRPTRHSKKSRMMLDYGCFVLGFLVPFHILLHQKYVQKISKAPTWRSYLKVKGFVFLVHFLFVLDCLWMSIIVPYVDAKPSAAAAGTTRPSQTKHLKVEQVHLQDRTVCASLNVTVHFFSILPTKTMLKAQLKC